MACTCPHHVHRTAYCKHMAVENATDDGTLNAFPSEDERYRDRRLFRTRWLPAQQNPEQREWLEALYAGDATMCECRLFDRDGGWYFHIVATRGVEEQNESSSAEARIGVDIGEASLVTVCHRDERGTPTTPNLWNDKGKRIRQLHETYFTATRRS
ncbi:hypothetical protein BG842_04975 [Haladaptatus sp. W1]|nr:hypothetical protein BG842_04975 [Haladaptatus sp. W1]